MKLKSALEDLRNTTLGAVSGILRKLEYLAGLQNSEKKHSHWGLERVYGQTTAKEALTDAHRAVLAQVLATPLRTLAQEAEDTGKSEGSSSGPYLEGLQSRGGELLPPEPGPGAVRHFNSVLHALLALARHRTGGATPPSASPPRPPVQ